MSKLISGKEALIALANGEGVEFFYDAHECWMDVKHYETSIFFRDYKFRIKTKTIPLNNIEVPAPFEPKEGDDCKCYHISTAFSSGFDWYHSSHHQDYKLVWKSEEEIKQVVAALRSIFKGE